MILVVAYGRFNTTVGTSLADRNAGIFYKLSPKRGGLVSTQVAQANCQQINKAFEITFLRLLMLWNFLTLSLRFCLTAARFKCPRGCTNCSSRGVCTECKPGLKLYSPPNSNVTKCVSNEAKQNKSSEYNNLVYLTTLRLNSIQPVLDSYRRWKLESNK